MKSLARMMVASIRAWLLVVAISVGVALLASAWLDWTAFGNFLYVGARPWAS